jgi:divalent metal cation (Fe/Co/Zn/Cd) transporter
LDKEEVEKIQNIIKNGKEVTGYHYLKTRESGSMKFVEVHIVFNKNISLLEAHNISDDLEQKIREIDKDSQWDVMIHLDPYDDRGNKEY